jgi:hypothetical protein
LPPNSNPAHQIKRRSMYMEVYLKASSVSNFWGLLKLLILDRSKMALTNTYRHPTGAATSDAFPLCGLDRWSLQNLEK